MPLVGKLLLNVHQPTVEPAVIVHRIACGMRQYQRQDQGFERWVFFSAAGRPAPGCRWRWGAPSGKPASTSRRPRRMVCRWRPVTCARMWSVGLSGCSEGSPLL
jgi:hypothetical protein